VRTSFQPERKIHTNEGWRDFHKIRGDFRRAKPSVDVQGWLAALVPVVISGAKQAALARREK